MTSKLQASEYIYQIEFEHIRNKANQTRNDLKNQTSNPGDADKKAYFDANGFIHLPKFCTNTEIQDMKQQMRLLAEENWITETKQLSGFTTGDDQESAQGSDDYFLNSANKVHFFAEQNLIDPETGALRHDANIADKMLALNKAGHGMHMIPGAFRAYSTSHKIKSLVQELGWVDPVIPQSMYIFKQPKVGGEVTSHQDSTFLYTTPRQTCLGLWLALDDATLENGCLWVRPGSHNEPVRRQFVRKIDDDDDDARKVSMTFQEAPDSSTASCCAANGHVSTSSIPWDGALPQESWPPPCRGLFEAGFVPVECKAGDLLAFGGQLDHLSLANYSDSARHTFQLHLVEGVDAGVTWSPLNWLQYPDGVPFLHIK